MNAEIIRFLDDLRRNNNTVWFHKIENDMTNFAVLLSTKYKS